MRKIDLGNYQDSLIQIAKEIQSYLQASKVPMDQAQDVTQEVFVQMLEASYDIPLDKCRSWMYRTAIRRYIDRYRRDKRYHEILKTSFFPKEHLLIYDQKDYEELYLAVSQLPSQQSQLIDLFYFQGFTIKEIAHLMGRQENWVKVNLSRARQGLRHFFTKEGVTLHDF